MSCLDDAPPEFGQLTQKQAETVRLLAEGLTAKEMAYALGISHSAVAQRIENLRGKFGGVTKNELARQARRWLASASSAQPTQDSGPWPDLQGSVQACEKDTGQKNHLPHQSGLGHQSSRNRFETELRLSDSFVVDASPPWASERYERLVPEVLDGEHAAPARWVFVVGLAIGMTVLLLVLLAVANALGDLA